MQVTDRQTRRHIFVYLAIFLLRGPETGQKSGPLARRPHCVALTAISVLALDKERRAARPDLQQEQAATVLSLSYHWIDYGRRAPKLGLPISQPHIHSKIQFLG